MMTDHYILDADNNPFIPTYEELLRLFEQGIDDFSGVAKTYIGDVFVSTLFLSVDPTCPHKGPPILFETMIFYHDEREDYQERYCTWDEAVKGHERACELVRKGDER